jgi:Mg2+ and Co2+ transporter CorA
MDSIVDNFFPLIEFIETESDDIDEFLANPLSDPRITGRSTGVMLANSAVNTTAKPRFLTVQVPAYIASRLPSILQKRLSRRSFDSKVYEMQNLGASAPVSKPRGLSSKKALRGVDDKLYDRGKMLHRIATARKIITAMSRMLGPKMDVVRGLRKRVKQEFVYVPGHRHDINIYLGDLQGETAKRIWQR